ncbi:hypothetical protein [Photorhabdus sp. SF281]|uniref:hypothetical protein n=1 Tax=Photorhabdus sp. SF281 TaxID=3459527 RepID=UPI004043DF8A
MKAESRKLQAIMEGAGFDGVKRVNPFDGFPPPFDFFGRSIEETHAMMSRLYVSDAYNSLSIEGYKVTPELIERLSSVDTPGR